MRSLFLLLTLATFSCVNPNANNTAIELTVSTIRGSVFGEELIESIIQMDSSMFLISRNRQIYEIDLSTDSIRLCSGEFEERASYFYAQNNVLKMITPDGENWKLEDSPSGKSGLKWIRINDENDRAASDFVEDDYTISSCCVGEWGGSVFFESKDGKLFSTEGTCLIDVDKLDEVYYLFNYLGHGTGFSNITKIGSVDKLPHLKENRDSIYCNWYYDELEEVGFENYDAFKRKNLGNTARNQVLLDTIGLKIIDGSVDENGVTIVYQSDLMIKRGKIENGQISEITTIIDTLYGKVDAASGSLNDDDDVLWFRTWDDIDHLSEIEYDHFLLIPSEGFTKGRLIKLN